MNYNLPRIYARRCLPYICSKYFAFENSLGRNFTSYPSYSLFNASDKNYLNLQVIRNKYTKKHETQKQEESDSESDSDDEVINDGIPDKSAKIVTVKVSSLRTDLIVKTALQIARNKVETIFYDSRIRVNGKKIMKKSAPVHAGDEIDVIRSVSPMNPDFLLVSRIEVLSAKAGEENITVKLRRFKSLTIENYSDPWKQTSSESI